MIEFIEGFKALIIGYRLIFRGGKNTFLALMPMLVSGLLTAVTLISLIVLFFTYQQDIFLFLMSQMVALSFKWSLFGFFVQQSWIIKGLLFVFLFFAGISVLSLSIYLIFLINKLISSPFNSLLAEQILIEKKCIQEKKFILWHWVSSNIKMTVTSLLEVLLFGFLGIILFIFSFIPLINLGTWFLGLLLISYDSLDYSLEILGLNLHKRLQYFLKNMNYFLGMALAMALFLMIPILNIFIFAACVAASAHIVSVIELKGKTYEQI